MCGIACVLNVDGHRSRIDTRLIERMRDRLAHRGPDDSGLWHGPDGAIGHRRLSVIDPTPSGHQPMVSPDGRYVLAYNGEIYNDQDVRNELATKGVQFQSQCDTETLLYALIEWGSDAVEHVRGMYAYVFLDTHEHIAIIARDPMGIKPLYFTEFRNGDGNPQLGVASEVSALLEHPNIDAQPDPVTLSAYLSSVRTTLGHRTMFAGIQSVLPGQCLVYRLTELAKPKVHNWWGESGELFSRSPTQGVQGTIEESVFRHLRTDVPMCALLSGGLDSSINTMLIRRSHSALNTYCAGAVQEGFSDDFEFAQVVAQELGTQHHQVELDEKRFVELWTWMIQQNAVPLSTPNEAAIYEVARVLSEAGHVVAISGEGADELFGGYGPIMQQASAHIESLRGKEDLDGGLFHLHSNAWVSEELKPSVLKHSWFTQANGDEHLRAYYQSVFQDMRSSCHENHDALEPHLRFQRVMNLTNLLQRLDTSTMLASVESRTPFADIEVATCAMHLPMSEKYQRDSESEGTKIALRKAFEGELPAEVIQRPKASFPLPFQDWMGSMGDMLFRSEVARSLFSEQAIGLVSARPASYWHMAWPMINLTLWGEQWLGNSVSKKPGGELEWLGKSWQPTTSYSA